MRGQLRRRRYNPVILIAAAAALVAGIAVVGVTDASASTSIGPYNIDGVIPDSGTGSAITDPAGSTKELGPINGSPEKIGVIHNAPLPMLGLTNPNAQVDLNTAYLDLRRVGSSDYLYFAWSRDSNSGSGFIAYEFMHAAAPTACAYATATAAALIAGCNPFANRAAGDFMILWDQQGGSRALYKRVWSGTAPNLTLGAPVALGSNAAAEYSADGFQGEAAVDLTGAGLTSGSGCTTLANTVPSTVTGNSDSADYKDTILTTRSLSSCKTVSIVKTDDASPGVPLADAVFKLYNNVAPLTGPRDVGTTSTADVITSPLLTCTTGADGLCSISGVPFGEYWVVETHTPANHDTAADQRVTVTSSSTTASLTVTFIDPLQVGSIMIRKTDGTNNLAGAAFSATLTGGSAVNIPLVTGSTSLFCLGGLPLNGTYAIAETTTPTDYNPQAVIPSVTVTSESTCAARAAAATPLPDLTIANTHKLGSILILKTDGTAALAGAAFTAQLTGGSAVNVPAVAGHTGLFCLGNLPTQGTYAIVESTTPAGYTGAATIPSVTVTTESTCAARVAATTIVPDQTVTNNPAPGTINVLKTDDLGNPLQGAVFTLYVDAAPFGTHEVTETTTSGSPQTTLADGTASFADVPLGKYCVVETTTPAGHATAPTQCTTVGLGTTVAGVVTGQTVSLTFVNPRTHRVIVIVCHEGTNTLDPSDVTLGTGAGSTKTSLSATGLTTAQENALCNTGGATFGSLPHGTVSPSVVIATH